MKKLALCLAVGIAALLPAAAAGRESLVPLTSGGHQFYVKACEASQAYSPRRFAAQFGTRRLIAVQRCVKKMIAAPHA